MMRNAFRLRNGKSLSCLANRIAPKFVKLNPLALLGSISRSFLSASRMASRPSGERGSQQIEISWVVESKKDVYAADALNSDAVLEGYPIK